MSQRSYSGLFVARKRFDQHRRQLLESLDPSGPVCRLSSWNLLMNEVEQVVKGWP
ncbi:hypothetical protein ABZ671_08460 [Micromonospora sp. NPDC006766]|uniref:hypothetical protein n=1 Tax=Micromonospora sp. NPDC006766 TaxID=3154778 RepID=UPI0033E3567E